MYAWLFVSLRAWLFWKWVLCLLSDWHICEACAWYPPCLAPCLFHTPMSMWISWRRSWEGSAAIMSNMSCGANGPTRPIDWTHVTLYRQRVSCFPTLLLRCSCVCMPWKACVAIGCAKPNRMPQPTPRMNANEWLIVCCVVCCSVCCHVVLFVVWD